MPLKSMGIEAWYLGMQRISASIFERREYRTSKGLCRDARTNMPESADSWILLGSVYAHIGQHNSQGSSENFEKAKRAFRKALTLEPLSMQATYQTVNVLLLEQSYVPAIELLKKSLAHCNDHVVHTELAKAYIKNAEYGLAIEHCQHAIAIAPYYDEAKETFDRAERGLKGLDPDGDQEEENHGDDGGDDSF